MSSSNPPNPYTPNTYNPSAWRVAGDTITTDYLDANYLRFNYAQGAENFVGVVNIGSLTQTGASQFGTAGSSAGIPTCVADYTGIAPTDSSTKIPTTSWVQTAISGSSSSSLPTGSIITFAGTTTTPTGYLVCDGSTLATSSYPGLFAVIGYTYGGSGGSFNTPNLVSKFIQGSTTNAGTTAGGSLTISNSNISATSLTSVKVGTQTPIVFNSATGISDWQYLKGLPSGDGTQNYWFPNTNNSTHNGTNLTSAFTTTIGVASPTPVNPVPSSYLMVYLIKT